MLYMGGWVDDSNSLSSETKSTTHPPALFSTQDKEGIHVAEWLSEEHGIASFILKYRVAGNG